MGLKSIAVRAYNVSWGLAQRLRPTPTPTGYWEGHNVSKHKTFVTAQDSLDYLAWRNEQYPGYSDLMPVAGFDGKTIVDFGCGPGNDLVGFSVYSNPAKLYGVDASRTSIKEARKRLAVHDTTVDLICHDVHQGELSVASGSVDLVHCSGVLQHLVDPRVGLREIRRLMKPDGTAQIMVYNRDSLWMHLYVAHDQQRHYRGMDMDAAFAKSTDGINCPFARCWSQDEFSTLAASEGLKVASYGAAISKTELELIGKIPDAIASRDVNDKSRDFLREIRIEDGLPMYRGQVAGIDGCYKLTAM